MSDDCPPILPRPDASPLLAFERFNPNGNSDEAVVFIKEENLLKFAGKHYVVVYGLADDGEVVAPLGWRRPSCPLGETLISFLTFLT
jgi:hypothetical protein